MNPDTRPAAQLPADTEADADLVPGGREMVVLGDGPWARHWYWRDDLEGMQAASRAVGYPDQHPSAQLRHYQPTGRRQPHPDGDGRFGQVWTYHPPDATPPAGASTGASTDAQAWWRPQPARPEAESVRSAGSPPAVRRRVLVTGSRSWTDTATIRDALGRVWGDGQAVLVTGGCPRGADRLAEQCWTAWGGQVETHPAQWDRHGAAAGFRRNAAMVGLGADECLVFHHDNSAGTAHAAGLAEQAGIPTRRFHQPATGAAATTGAADDQAASSVPTPWRPPAHAAGGPAAGLVDEVDRGADKHGGWAVDDEFGPDDDAADIAADIDAADGVEDGWWG